MCKEQNVFVKLFYNAIGSNFGYTILKAFDKSLADSCHTVTPSTY
jgi:hypothetical protein